MLKRYTEIQKIAAQKQREFVTQARRRTDSMKYEVSQYVWPPLFIFPPRSSQHFSLSSVEPTDQTESRSSSWKIREGFFSSLSLLGMILRLMPILFPVENRQQVQALESEIEFNEAMIAEREEGIKDIESSIAQVNEIFKDLSMMVREQGETLGTFLFLFLFSLFFFFSFFLLDLLILSSPFIKDTIEGNIISMTGHTTDANTELGGANKYQVKLFF